MDRDVKLALREYRKSQQLRLWGEADPRQGELFDSHLHQRAERDPARRTVGAMTDELGAEVERALDAQIESSKSRDLERLHELAETARTAARRAEELSREIHDADASPKDRFYATHRTADAWASVQAIDLRAVELEESRRPTRDQRQSARVLLGDVEQHARRVNEARHAAHAAARAVLAWGTSDQDRKVAQAELRKALKRASAELEASRRAYGELAELETNTETETKAYDAVSRARNDVLQATEAARELRRDLRERRKREQ